MSSPIRIDSPHGAQMQVSIVNGLSAIHIINKGVMVGAPVDPQALVDALAELFPDVKPSPPRPKVGDRVKTPGDNLAEVMAVFDGWAVIRRFDRYENESPWTFELGRLTVVERGPR